MEHALLISNGADNSEYFCIKIPKNSIAISKLRDYYTEVLGEDGMMDIRFSWSYCDSGRSAIEERGYADDLVASVILWEADFVEGLHDGDFLYDKPTRDTLSHT